MSSDDPTPDSGVQRPEASLEEPGARGPGRARQGGSPRKAAMDLLARREHSRWELQRKLRRRFDRGEACADAEHDGDSGDPVTAAVETLAREGLQSDARFALSFTRERLLRGQGPRRIRAELLQRSVEERLIDAALDQVPEEEHTSWAEQARNALAKRFGSTPPMDFPERARRMRFLDQRGFAAEHMPPELTDD